MPEMEERDAMVAAHYTRPDWMALDYFERVYTVAHYRMTHRIRLHSEEAQTMHADMARRRQGA